MKLRTDGYFCDDQILFADCGKGSSVAKGYQLLAPTTDHASVATSNQIEDELRVLLRSIKGGANLQFCFQAGGDYKQDLIGYYDRTENLPCPDASRSLRNGKFTDLWHLYEAGKLRRDTLQLFLNLPLAELGSGDARAQLAASAAAFEHHGNVFDQTFRRMGGTATPMSDREHYEAYLKFFNPSCKPSEHHLNPLASIQENCFLSETAPVKAGDHGGFWMGHQYHGIRVIKSLPQATFSGMIAMLTGLPLLDYSITVNVRPLDLSDEIHREERASEKLQNAMRHNSIGRMQAAYETHQEQIRRLMSNEVAPFRAQFIIRAWHPNLAGLQAKLSTLESSILKLNGASYYSPSLPPTARNYFVASMPGWTRGEYDDYAHHLEDHHVANLLPVSSSPTGFLDDAEAIYHGTNGNLIGLRTFMGQDASPQHAFITGMTGAGKSVLLSDLLLQTEPYYSFTAIVDDGMSHAPYIEKVSSQPPILIRGDGNVTFNYLDTQGLPLSPEHMGDAVGMVLVMTQAKADDSPMTAAVASEALAALYSKWHKIYSQKLPDKLLSAARLGILTSSLRTENPGMTLTEAFLELKSGGSERLSSQTATITDTEAAEYATKHATSNDLRRLFFAVLEPHEMPTHSHFVSLLEAQSDEQVRNADVLGKIATLLRRWKRGGDFGPIVDGVTNVSFSGSHVHIDLGKSRETNPELRSLAAFLVTNNIRNEVMNRPRHQRKRVVLEELGGFLTIPGGEKIVNEFYSRMRKYSTWVVSVIQQKGMFKDSPASVSLLGNSRIGIFLKQESSEELKELAKHFPLPDSTLQAISTFNEADRENGAPFIYYHAGTRPMIATGRHILPQTRVEEDPPAPSHLPAENTETGSR